MDLYRIWRILVGHKWLLIWLPIVATLGGLGATYALPEQYESTALVLVRPFEDFRSGAGGGDKKDLLDFPVTLSAPVDAPSKTYIEVIKSPAVAVKIVEALHLDVKAPKKYDSWFEELRDEVKTWFNETLRTVMNYARYGRDIPASPFDRAMEDIEKKLVVAARKDTYAFDITYRSGNPQEAAAVANKAADIFLEQRSDTYHKESAQTREFLESQVDGSRKALDQARAAVLAYKNSGGTFELSSEYSERLKSLTELENILAKTEGKLAGQRRAYPPGSTTLLEQESEVSELRGQISALRTQLAAYPKKETRLNDLTLAEKVAEDSYKYYLKQYDEARVKESAKVTEIRVASRAEPGLYPTKPLKWMYAGLSFATALVVAIGWALVSETLNPRIRTARDLDDEFGMPVLGAIPTLRRSWRGVGT